MKKAVAYLTPFIEASKIEEQSNKGKIFLKNFQFHATLLFVIA
jgi:cobalamin-dependent methionine synthase I